MIAIVLHEDVHTDIKGSYEWYENALESLGLQFISELEIGFDAISYALVTWSTFEHGFRRHLLSRFPFSIIYKEKEHQVLVLAVMHNSRNPEYWKERVDGEMQEEYDLGMMKARSNPHIF